MIVQSLNSARTVWQVSFSLGSGVSRMTRLRDRFWLFLKPVADGFYGIEGNAILGVEPASGRHGSVV